MAHRFHFFRAGGVDQVSLRDGRDLAALGELDQKLWVALAMPNHDVDVDPATLALLDDDHDGRIRVPDVLAAVRWVEQTCRDPGDVLAGGDTVRLDAIREPKVLAAAQRILRELDKGDAEVIALQDALDVVHTFEETILNGDGIVIPESALDDDTRQAIADVIGTTGSVRDRSGKPGVDATLVDGFFADADRLAAWADAGDDPALRPLGDATAAAADALDAVRAKIEDHFVRGRLAAFDPRAAHGLAPSEAELAALGARTLTHDDEEIARLPIARVEPDRPLPLSRGINPAWADRIARFREATVAPILGRLDELAAEDLARIVERLAPFLAWRASRPIIALDALPLDRVRALARGDARARIRARIAADLTLADEYGEIHAVEKLLRYQRDLARVLRNFVNFSDFYARQDAAFQFGTLYIDARACRLVVPVADAARHAMLAAMSSAHLVYCDVVRGAEKREIVAAVTNGDADHLVVGRNGVYYDRAGEDWDATITRVVANPISVREAFWTPYKKLARMIEQQIGKRASAAEAAADTRVAGTATAVATADHALAQPVAAAPAAPLAPLAPRSKIDVGTVAAIGVAIGGIGAMLVGILSAFLGLGLWMPIGVVVLLLLISGPSMLLAWMKLRQRNIGPLLDANGWAINGRARINVAFGAALTDLARLPRGAQRSLDDPFEDRGRPWRLYLATIALLGLAATWYEGRLDRWLPRAATSREVLGDYAPSRSTQDDLRVTDHSP